jgi:membrane protease YdiL (CAAX protease family)
MHILGATAAVDPSSLLLPMLLAVAAVLAVGLGVFRRRSIVGPNRWESDTAPESLAIAICMGAGAYLLYVSLSATATPGMTAIEADLVGRALGVSAIFAVLAFTHHPIRLLGLSSRKLPAGLLWGLLCILVVLPVVLVVSELWATFYLKKQFTHELLTLLGNTHDAGFRALLLTSILAAAPASEEIFFRGTMQTWLSNALSNRLGESHTAGARWLAVIVTSVIFACVHPWWSWPPIFVLAVCLGYVYERTGNLWACIFIHALFNGAEVYYFYLQA